MKTTVEDRIEFVAGCIESAHDDLLFSSQFDELDRFDEIIQAWNRRGWNTGFERFKLSDEELATAEARAWLAIYQ